MVRITYLDVFYEILPLTVVTQKFIYLRVLMKYENVFVVNPWKRIGVGFRALISFCFYD